MKKNIIITAVDDNCSDFIINHWWTSLKKNVDLTNIDTVVIDYGLNESIQNKLQTEGVRLFSGSTGKNIMINRFRDAAEFLNNTQYDQILLIDGGDIIFQKDLGPIFSQSKNLIRARSFLINPYYYKYFISLNFPKYIQRKLLSALQDKPVYNCGVIFGPRLKIIKLCKNIYKLSRRFPNYSSDQVIANYFLFQEKVRELQPEHNFTPGTSSSFMVTNGRFYDDKNNLVSIVHNAGRYNIFRVIDNFGFGPENNRINPFKIFIKKIFYFAMQFFNKLNLLKRTL